LRNAQALLKGNGLLVLNELSSHSLYAHVTFGLLDGWWLYEDAGLRLPGSPGLYPATWKRLLRGEGFNEVWLPSPQAQDFGQQIIVAQSNGIVRQAARQTAKQVTKQHSEHTPAQHTSKSVTNTAKTWEQAAKPTQTSEQTPASGNGDLESRIVSLVTGIVAEILRMSPTKIEADTPFEQYGIDSIIQVGLIRKLEEIAGPLPSTLLFEYVTVAELCTYLVSDHREILLAYLGEVTKAPVQSRTVENSNLELPTANPVAVVKEMSSSDDEAIAIIGLSGRYPMAETLDAYWGNILSGRNCIVRSKPDRWLGANVEVYGGFLDDTNRFDHGLFGIPSEQVTALAPEIRLMLEAAWGCFEDAGYSRVALREFQNLAGQGVGVFVGAMYNQYALSLGTEEAVRQAANASDWHIVNRISHAFDLTGPSIALNTACSASLHAIHMACESLRQKSCSMALVGGVNLALDPSKYQFLDDIDFLGSGGLSKGFGAGDGMIPGEGAGAALLKPLKDAERDGDRIDGIIRGSFANHAGGRQMYGAPDPVRQADLIAEVIERSGVDVESISYVEAAVNGSELGDPIEVVALKKAFARFTDKKDFCALGSVKSTIGHLEAASGISQLSKVVLQFRHGTLAPSINATPRNPNIKLENSPFSVQEVAAPWLSTEGTPRRALVNSFGAGGSYAALIIEEPASTSGTLDVDIPLERQFVLSAMTKFSLVETAQRLLTYLLEHTNTRPVDVAVTLAKRNNALPYRLAVTAITMDELCTRLTLFVENQEVSPGVELSEFNSRDVKAEEEIPIVEDIGSVLPLPVYAFDHSHSFISSKSELKLTGENILFRPDEPYLADHLVDGKPVLIGMTYASIALDHFRKNNSQVSGVELRKLLFLRPLEVEHATEVRVDINDGEVVARFRREEMHDWEVVATGRIAATASRQAQEVRNLELLREGLSEMSNVNSLYEVNPIVNIGPSLKTVEQLWHNDDCVLAKASINQDRHKYGLHPLTIYSAFLAAVPLTQGQGDGAFLPFGIKSLTVHDWRMETRFWVSVRRVKTAKEFIEFDAELLQEDGAVFLTCMGCTLKRVHDTASTIEDAPELALKLAMELAVTADPTAGALDYLIGCVASLMDGDDPALDKSFLELGLSSAAVLRLMVLIEDGLGVELEATDLFEYPNIESLAVYLVELGRTPSEPGDEPDVETTDSVVAALEKLIEGTITAAEAADLIDVEDGV
ncbi:MAG: beta-ketoacyl synthase N-terminal-like domain-containing protein, partial [Halopseudomonas aestusnigri]